MIDSKQNRRFWHTQAFHFHLVNASAEVGQHFSLKCYEISLSIQYTSNLKLMTSAIKLEFFILISSHHDTVSLEVRNEDFISYSNFKFKAMGIFQLGI